MNKAQCCIAALLALACCSATAGLRPWDYRIKLTKNTGDLDVTAHTFVGPAVVVGLKNNSKREAFCAASFVSYPHAPASDEFMRAAIAPGKTAP